MGNVTAYVNAAIVGTLVCMGCGGASAPAATVQGEEALSQTMPVDCGAECDAADEADPTAADGEEGFTQPTILGRMTGGGRVRNGELSVSHGFELHCSVTAPSQNLEVNWGGHRFHLTQLTESWCGNLMDLGNTSGGAGFDTIMGVGIGRLDGVDGAQIQFVFTDGGEPGRNDGAGIVVVDADGTLAATVYGQLTFGNQQAHKENP